MNSSEQLLGLSFGSHVIPPLRVQLLLNDTLCSLNWCEKQNSRWRILTCSYEEGFYERITLSFICFYSVAQLL